MAIGPSLEDLLSSAGPGETDSQTRQLQKKIQQITLKEKEQEVERQAQLLNLPYINLLGFGISPDTLTTLPPERCQELQVICFLNNGREIRLGAVAYTEAVKNLEPELAEKFHANVSTYLISPHSLEAALKLYDSLPKVRKFVAGVEITEAELKKFENEIKDFRELNEKINQVSITEVMAMILAAAIRIDASDVHIEAEEHGVVVRLRLDGVLQETAVIDRESWKKVISRLKILAKVKINIIDRPQDGRYSIFLNNEKIDVRCSFLPTAFGESVVMRLLRAKAVGLSFEELGLLPSVFNLLEKEIQKPNGLILSAGPTGSGKTTTLYAILKKLNQPDVKVITLEDPIEYQLKGINQSQVDSRKDYTFAKGLRSVLRQDPDIVMVGEIRDLETAEIAIQASLTGHLVLSTVHTNDAAGVLPRLLDIGVKPFFVVPAINAVIGQRLVRRLCPKCRVEHQLNEEEAETVKKILAVVSPKSGVTVPPTLPTIYKAGAGCDYCNGVGYKGRIGIYEILTMNEKLKALTSEGAPAFKILEQAIEEGMITMLQDGVLKCLQGITSLDEVYRVIGKLDYIDALYDIVISQTIGRGIKLKEENITQAKELVKDLSHLTAAVIDLPAQELTAMVIATALESNAGDIHIEPTENNVKIRFRIDGILHEVISLPKESYLPLLSNIKILAGFPTNVKRAAWDGRFGIFLKDERMDSRVSIISGGYGETVVIRLLSSQATALDIKELGMRPYTLKILEKSIKKTKGIIITTGPTGSGKTTTLYSILNQLNKPDVKIITIEDPIEYHLEGVMQTQIDIDEGYTFATAMRSLLRQNPNIMMIGEIRDEETAKIAIEAAMTGHLVLSTIHTNSAAGSIPRFEVLGIEPQMLASSIECAIGQRLVRRLCPNCKEPTELEPNILKEVEEILQQINPKSEIKIPKILKFYRAKGCEKCGNIGYKGRLGVYEVIELTPDLQKLIQQPNVTAYDIEQAAIKNGAVLVLQDGILKALEGETTVEEVFRVAK
jgi:type II secretory ATPase GspE/PulE/Tfp pilus assembly ATPase PilB-like protein